VGNAVGVGVGVSEGDGEGNDEGDCEVSIMAAPPAPAVTMISASVMATVFAIADFEGGIFMFWSRIIVIVISGQYFIKLSINHSI
jgi:hypothetical protein